MNKQYASHDIILIDREVYEYLGPLHRATADILVAKGRCRIVELDEDPTTKVGCAVV